MDSLATSVAAQFKHVLYTSFFTMACYATDLCGKKRLRVQGERFIAPLILNLDRLSERNARRVR